MKKLRNIQPEILASWDPHKPYLEAQSKDSLPLGESLPLFSSCTMRFMSKYSTVKYIYPEGSNPQTFLLNIRCVYLLPTRHLSASYINPLLKGSCSVPFNDSFFFGAAIPVTRTTTRPGAHVSMREADPFFSLPCPMHLPRST